MAAEVTTIGQMLDRQFDRDKEAWEALQASGRLEYHCRKHGVVRNVTEAEFGSIARALDYVYGHRSYWNTAARKVDGVKVYDLEFVYQCTGGSAERCSKPWEWCGTTVLFADWQQRETETRKLSSTFRTGQRVSFEVKGQRKSGLVVRVNGKSVAVVVEGEGEWRISPEFVTLG